MDEMKPLICFDVDETLVHSNNVHIKSFNKAFIKNNLKPINEKRLAKALQGESSETIIKKFYPRLREKDIEKVHLAKRRFVIKETYRYVKQIDKSSKILKDLKKHYRIALISNCVHQEIKKMLDFAKIRKESYDFIIGKDEVKHPKPYPDEIFKAEKLAKEKADFMVGDSLQDIKAARRAKIRIITVLTGNTPKERLINAKPDYIVNSIKDVPKILLKR